MDHLVCGYPKSGTTWVRIFLYLYFYSRTIDMDKMEKKMPNLGTNFDLLSLFYKNRFLKSHDINLSHSWSGKTILIVRDPRSVFLSAFHYSKRMKFILEESSYETFIDDFVNGNVLNLNFNWKDHFRYWSKLPLKLEIFKYEDLISNPTETFYDLLSHLVKKVDLDRFSFAVENSSFDSVKNYESKNKTDVRRWKSTNTKIIITNGQTPIIISDDVDQ